MLSLEKKASFILGRTAHGKELCSEDKVLVDCAIHGSISESDLPGFEQLFEYVRQNNEAPKRWLFDLPGLALMENGEVRFGDRVVDRFRLENGKVSPTIETFARETLYPACLLAKRYRYRHLSMTRIPFFINELLGKYCLQSTSADTYFEKHTDFPPVVDCEYGFLFGHPACMKDDQTPMYQPFLRFEKEFFFCERFLTIEEFKSVSVPTWVSYLPDDKKAKVAASLVQ